MPGAGFIGATAPDNRRRRRNAAAQVITASVVPASSVLVVGQSLSDTANWPLFLDPANYATSASGESISAVTVNYIGSTGTASESLADGDINAFGITVTDTGGNARTFSTVPRTVLHSAPAARGALDDQSLTAATGLASLDAAAAFSGTGLSFALSGPAGVSIDAATGLVSFDTGVLAVQSGTPVTVTASNSGGSATAGFALTVQAPVVYAAGVTGLVNNPTHGLGARVGTMLSGEITNLRGSETVLHRWRLDGSLIAGATAVSYTPAAGDDLGLVQYAPLINGEEVASPSYRVRFAPPVAASLAPVDTVEGGGGILVNLVPGFTGDDLSYTETVDWASIAGSTLTIDDAARSDTLTITATNSGGQATVDLAVTIARSVETALVFTIETTVADETFTVPFRPMNTSFYDGTVDMGGGAGVRTFSNYNDPNLTETYATPGIHTIRITGRAHSFKCDDYPADRLKIRTVENFGLLNWQDMFYAFNGASGMTSFNGGNTDTSQCTSWYSAFNGCTSMVTCNITGMSTAASKSMQGTWNGCTVLTSIDTSGWDTSNVIRMDETFWQCPALDGTSLTIAGFDLSSLEDQNPDPAAANGGMFNFIGVDIDPTDYAQFLTNIDGQTLNTGLFFAFNNTVPATQAGVDARASLIDKGQYFTDGLTDVPDRMVAPSLAVTSSTEIAVTPGPAPFNNGLPIIRYDLRYSTDESTWIEVTGVTDPQAISDLTTDTRYYVQTRALNFRAVILGGTYENWSASATATTTVTPQRFTATRSGTDLVLAAVPDISPQTFSAQASGSDLFISFAGPVATPAPTQIAVIDAANHDGTAPETGGYAVQVLDLGAEVNNVYTLSGVDIPAGAMVALLDPRADVVGGGFEEFERVVFIGASIMEQTFGSSLTQRNTAAEAAFAAAGVSVEVYAHAASGLDAGQVQTLLSEAMASFPGKTLFFVHAGGNNVTANRPYPGGETVLTGQLDGLIDVAATRPGSVILSDLTFRDYGGTTATNEAAGAKPYNDSIYLPAFRARAGDLLSRAYYADGTPVSCLYEWSWENRAGYLSGDNIHPENPGGRALLRDWLAARLAPICLGLPAPAQFVRTAPPPAPALDIFVEYGVQTAAGVNTPAFAFLAGSGQTSDGPFALLNTDGTDPGASLTLNFSAPAPGNNNGFGINTAGNGDGAPGFDGTLMSSVFTGDSYFAGAAYTVDHVISGLASNTAYRVELIASRNAGDSRETRYDFSNGETATIQTTADPTQTPVVIDTLSDGAGRITITQSAVSGSWSYLGGLHIFTA